MKIGDKLAGLSTKNLHLSMISNRGIKVWPKGMKETFCTDHWRCRFKAGETLGVDSKEVLEIMSKVMDAGVDVIKTENFI